MAARSLAIELGEPKAMAAGDLTKVLQALESFRRDTTEANAAIREDLATLKAEAGYTSSDVKELSRKMEEIQKLKAERSDFSILEQRMERSVADVRAGAAFEAGHINKGLSTQLTTLETQLEDFEKAMTINLTDFKKSVDHEFELLREKDIREIRDQVKSHEVLRNRMVGGWTVAASIGGFIATIGGWIIAWFKSR